MKIIQIKLFRESKQRKCWPWSCFCYWKLTFPLLYKNSSIFKTHDVDWCFPSYRLQPFHCLLNLFNALKSKFQKLKQSRNEYIAQRKVSYILYNSYFSCMGSYLVFSWVVAPKLNTFVNLLVVYLMSWHIWHVSWFSSSYVNSTIILNFNVHLNDQFKALPHLTFKFYTSFPLHFKSHILAREMLHEIHPCTQTSLPLVFVNVRFDNID